MLKIMLKKETKFLISYILLILAIIIGFSLGLAAIFAREEIKVINNTKIKMPVDTMPFEYLDWFKEGMKTSSTPSSITTHVNITLAFAVIAFAFAIIATGLLIVISKKPLIIKTERMLTIASVLLLLVIIFGSIAVQYANDSINQSWLMKEVVRTQMNDAAAKAKNNGANFTSTWISTKA